MNQLNDLKGDMLELIELSAEISKLNQMYLYHADMCDKRNYDEVKCNKIKIHLHGLNERFDELKSKWF